MANIDNAYRGFEPVARLDGSDIPVRRFHVDGDGATAIYIGDLIDAEADGCVIAAAADAGDSLLGACVAVYDSNGVPCGAPNSSVSTKYLTGSTEGYVDVALALPDSVFKCQALTGTTPTAADVFMASNHTAGAGSTTLARSGHELTCTFSAANQFKVIGKVDEPGNDWGAHVDLLVVASESFWLSGDANGL